MRSKARYAILILLIILAAAVTSGCFCCAIPVPGSSGIGTIFDPTPVPIEGSRLKEADSMAEIDSALESGPVFIEFGAPWCQYCNEQKLVLAALSKEYENVTFLEVNKDNSPALAKEFYVSGIPQMNAIIRKNADGSYLYVDGNGMTVTDRKKSSIIGYTRESDVRKVLDAAVAARSGP